MNYVKMAGIALLFGVLSSCVRDETEQPRTGSQATFRVSIPSRTVVKTRSEPTTVGTENENKLHNLLLLTFDGNGNLVGTATPTPTTDNPDDNYSHWSFTVNPAPEQGRNLMLLANVEATKIESLTTKNTIAAALSYDQGWPASTVPSTGIPMWGEIPYYDSSAPYFEMVRMVSRIDVEVADGVPFTMQRILLYNYNTKGYVVPDEYSYNYDAPTNWSESALTKTPGPQEFPVNSAGSSYTGIYTCESSKGVDFDFNNLAWQENTCLVIEGYYDGSEKETYYRVDFIDGEGDYLALLRNYLYLVQIKRVNGPGYGSLDQAYESAAINITATTKVIGSAVSVDGPYFLRAERSIVEFGESSHMSLDYAPIATNYPGGWEFDRIEFLGSDTGWLTAQKVDEYETTDNGYTVYGGDIELEISEEPNLGAPRYAWVYVTAGRMTIRILVKHGYDENSWTWFNPMPYQYVGAFWRADETGERIIRLTHPNGMDKYWEVNMIYYDDRWKESEGDGVVFSLDPSVDTGINFWDATSENPGDAEGFQVTETDVQMDETDIHWAGGVSGWAGYVYFRMGLQQPFSPINENSLDPEESHPVRYAVAEVKFYNSLDNSGAFTTHKLYLRQGELDDYLMAPGDPDEAGGDNFYNRAAARRWTAYNLTAASFTSENSSMLLTRGGIWVNDPTGENSSKLLTRGGTWVNYPTQAGAFFQWSAYDNDDTYRRVAYHPTASGAPTPWPIPSNNNDEITGFSWHEDDETCPITNNVFYRRPKGNDELSVLEINEVWPSLLSRYGISTEVNAGNSTYGYYADGYFDRRAVVNPVGDTPGVVTCVAKESKDVAYAGRLAFNPVESSPRYNASLFFPMPGYRATASGLLQRAGSEAMYWTMNRKVDGLPYALGVYGDHILPYLKTNGSQGSSVRCVRDPEQSDIAILGR